MNDKQKGYFGVAIVLVLFVFAWAAFQYVSAYSRSIQPSSFRSFSVSGDGKAVGIPDVAAFTFGIVTEGGKDIATLQSENTKKVNAAIAFLKSSGVEAKDIKTEYYSLDPRYQYFNCNTPIYYDNARGGTTAPSGASTSIAPSPKPCPPSEIVGYTINNTVSVKVRNFEKVGEIIAGVTAAGANTVSSLNFTIDDPTMLENEARAEAIAKAKAKAESIARAGGFRLGRLLSIEENNSYYPYRAYDAFGKGGAELTAAPAPMIEPGSQDTTVTVTLRYEIK